MASPCADSRVILEVSGLRVFFPIQRGIFKRVVGHTKAVDGVSFVIREGETLGLVGESGCGKTTTCRSILRLIQPTEGKVLYRDSNDRILNIPELRPSDMKVVRKDLQMIFQDPHSSLNPRMTIYDIVAEPLRIHRVGSRSWHRDKVGHLLEEVGLSTGYMDRYPNEFSGGQRQRIGIARALALDPRLIVCDEPVSALDVSIQAQIINLLGDLQTELALTYLMIAHDLSVIYHISDRVAVMYLGKIVESTDKRLLYHSPRHPYSEALMSAIPSPDPDATKDHLLIEGDVPDPSKPPPGCYFHTRCRYAVDVCTNEEPPLEGARTNKSHHVACHREAELALRPAPMQKMVRS